MMKRKRTEEMNGNTDEYSYVRGLSTAGFIYTHGRQRYFFHTTAEPNRRTMVFPPQCSVCSSEMGLVLLHRLTNAGAGSDANANANANTLYLVCNPVYEGSERYIPNPPRPHTIPMPRVLIVGWDATRLCLVFHIVCAVPVARTSVYSFDVYSSITDAWDSTRTIQVNLAQMIRENTGVACGTRAYWLLDSRVPTVAYYDVKSRRTGTIQSPVECALYSTPFLPQLGRWGCQLCLVVILNQLKAIHIFTLGQDDTWLPFHEHPYSDSLPPTLSRFQSAKLQVPFWCEFWSENRLFFLENGWHRITKFRDCAWPKLDSPEPNSIHYVLPHVSTDWLPLLHFPIVR